eukprot:1159236-Pelagomonas_calceolata.AAC.3
MGLGTVEAVLLDGPGGCDAVCKLGVGGAWCAAAAGCIAVSRLGGGQDAGATSMRPAIGCGVVSRLGWGDAWPIKGTGRGLDCTLGAGGAFLCWCGGARVKWLLASSVCMCGSSTVASKCGGGELVGTW